MATPLWLCLIDEGAGTTLNDTSTGSPVNATITTGGASTWTTNSGGACYNFDGNAFAIAGAGTLGKIATALAGSKTVTVEFEYDSVADAEAVVFYLGDGSANSVFQIRFVDDGGGVMGVLLIVGDATYHCTAIPTGRHRLMCAVNSDNAAGSRVTTYIDGTVISSPDVYGELTAGSAIDVNSSTWANNGISLATYALTANSIFNGKLSLVALYSAELTSADASAHNTAILANNDADPNSGGGGGNTMTVAGTAPVATSAVALASTDSFTVVGTAPVATSAIALASKDSLLVAATVPVATSAIALGSTDSTSIAATVPVATMAAALTAPDYVVSIAADVPAPTCAASLASTNSLTVAGVAPVATMAAALVSTDSLAIAATVPVSTMAATLTAGQNNVAVDATVPPPTCAAALASTDFLAVASVAPAPTMAAVMLEDEVMSIATVVPGAAMSASMTAVVPAPPAPSRPDVSGFLKRVYV